MKEMSRRDLAVTAAVALAIIAAVELRFLRQGHIVGLLFAYVAVSVGSIALSRSDGDPTARAKAALVAVTFLVVAVPVAGGVRALPSETLPWPLQIGYLVGRWALPVSLTVAVGIFETRAERRRLAVGHAIALLALLAGGAVVYGSAGVLIAAVGRTLGYYALGAVVAYPAVLSYRQALAPESA
ncbi:hypothetical protein [Natronomonas amylolytica]|uniref:hypothetical protein n=1 Tax=Natronomonas amylolytica TaxID=3108498 RepID=UPI0030096BB5